MSNEPVTPENLLLKIILSNIQILQKMTAVMEQQIIYTNVLLFPNSNNNDRPTVANTATNSSSGKTDGFQDSNPNTSQVKPSSTESSSNKSESKKN